jgi:hypothetical protein
MKVRGFTEIQDSLGSHLVVPYFCKALVIGLYPTHKSLLSGDSSAFDKHFGTIFKDGCSSDTHHCYNQEISGSFMVAAERLAI